MDNPVELMTKGTGGKEYSFVSQRGLETAISEIGRELAQPVHDHLHAEQRRTRPGSTRSR